MRINFDMDGTIANFYGVENWLDYLKAEDTKPYEIAKPLFNFSAFARLLNKAKRNGYVTIEDAEGKKTYSVKLTDEGRKLAEASALCGMGRNHGCPLRHAERQFSQVC